MKSWHKLFLLTLCFALPAFALAAEFTPLTNLPGVRSIASTQTLPTFFNNLYKLCIGAAAVIAILQIMRAGVSFMFNKGSVAQNEKAKGLITNSVLGLLLVLSPAIVFGIINPEILNLRLNLSGLESGTVNSWLQNCNIETTPQQRECLGTKEEQIRTMYQQCIASHRETASECLHQAQVTADLGRRGCIDNFGTTASTPEQRACLDEQVRSFVGASTADERGPTCEAFDQSSLVVAYRGASCPVGTEPTPALSCCHVTFGDGATCCGVRTQSRTNYVIEYYYTQQQGGTTCYISGVRSATTASECQTLKASIQGAFGNATVNFVKTCEVMSSVPTSFTPDVTVPRCEGSANHS